MKNFIVVALLMICVSCKKELRIPDIITPPKDSTVVVVPPVDPPTAATIGFFMNEWTPKHLWHLRISIQ